MMTPRISCPGEECHSSPGRTTPASAENQHSISDGHASRSLNPPFFPPGPLRFFQRRLLLKPVREDQCGARRHINRYRWPHYSPPSRNRGVVHLDPAKLVDWSTAINTQSTRTSREIEKLHRKRRVEVEPYSPRNSIKHRQAENLKMFSSSC